MPRTGMTIIVPIAHVVARLVSRRVGIIAATIIGLRIAIAVI